MQHTELNKGIGTILEKYKEQLSKVKTYTPTTLFDLDVDWKKVKQGKCGICGNKLRVPRGKKIAYCSGKRHPDKRKFLIRLEILGKILE